MAKRERCWRSIVRRVKHADNGKGNGGAITGIVFLHLACGHVRPVPLSKQPLSNCVVCRECEAAR